MARPGGIDIDQFSNVPRQIIAEARALVIAARPPQRGAVWEHVLDLRDSFKTTMIVTSHLMEEIDHFCDRIALINRGRIAVIDTPAALKSRIGPNATLDDVFIRLVSGNSETEDARSYGDIRRTRNAAREHG
jgi:ABC-2 type transport system ATP-binding protein